ncbi:AbrB/MazE/SpoVT family DNA-binding domain-containing protein [Paraburkholderia humisilvae]|uniref:SpoVT-AbrB domain-containing protein n=1 Tax=Paraburkholderia humisilvae TaxID=627669 RepID=A0A6J5F7L5_9BURK|nr:AbrB/MazE/SpoVT family DNA-binding domain-containing protein [Paraburkholderia humisilvae]CAB3773781.1 hypothetical protein LMG29542_07436 [Paraburkholderia humisilvae]
MLVSKWGNSLAVRLPAPVVDSLDLHEGDDIEIVADAGRFVVARKMTKPDLLARFDEFRGTMPADFKFDRAEANER